MNIFNIQSDLSCINKMKEDGNKTISEERSQNNPEVKIERETRKTKRDKKEKAV